jgi:acylphosphatase
MNTHYHAFVIGNVQGVGFRYTAQMLAHKYACKGWVMNLSDGRVELEIEGDISDIHNFLQALRDEFEEYIHNIETHESTYTGAYSDFRIQLY